jgi:hypothetical protein
MLTIPESTSKELWLRIGLVSLKCQVRCGALPLDIRFLYRLHQSNFEWYAPAMVVGENTEVFSGKHPESNC